MDPRLLFRPDLASRIDDTQRLVSTWQVDYDDWGWSAWWDLPRDVSEELNHLAEQDPSMWKTVGVSYVWSWPDDKKGTFEDTNLSRYKIYVTDKMVGIARNLDTEKIRRVRRVIHADPDSGTSSFAPPPEE